MFDHNFIPNKRFVWSIVLATTLGASKVSALTLNGAIEAALKNNPALSMARDAESSQKYKKYGANVSRLGEVTAIGNSTRYNLERTLVPVVPPIKPPYPPADDTILNLGVSYTFPIFTGFKLSKNISIASLSYEIAKAQSSLTQKQVVYNVYSLFLKGLALKEQLQAKLEQEKALDELHKNIEVGVNVGRYVPIDLMKVDYQREMVKAQRQGLEGSLTSLKSALNQLTGMDSEDWDFEAAELTLKDTPSLNELLQSALRDREEISISERKKGIASANYSKAKFSYFPDINFNYLYYRTEGGGANLPIWNYGVSAQLPIFDFGKRGFEMAGQKQDMKSAESAIAAQELAVRHEVVEAYSNLHTQTDTHAAAKKALDYAKETKDVENVKYQQGVGDMYDLLLSLSQYYDALSQERGTYYAIFTAEKYLEFASGGKL